jgi:hypothetical protein
MVLDKKLFNRVFAIQGILVLLGLIGFTLARGRIGGMSFVAGATVGTLSLWLLLRGISATQGGNSAPLALVMMSGRLIIAGFVLYVILRTYEVHLWAAASGLLTHIIAIVLATLYDHFHARTP